LSTEWLNVCGKPFSREREKGQGNCISDCDEEGSEESVGSVGFFHFAAQGDF